MNRGVARMRLFEQPADYQAFEAVLREILDETPMRICAYAMMPNHWHLLVSVGLQSFQFVSKLEVAEFDG